MYFRDEEIKISRLSSVETYLKALSSSLTNNEENSDHNPL